MKRFIMVELVIVGVLCLLTGCTTATKLNTQTAQNTPTTMPSVTTNDSSQIQPPVNGGNNSVTMTADQAKKIALENANVAEGSTWGLRVEQGMDAGKYVYEVDFNYNGKEYDYDIDANTGEILGMDIDIAD
ncbi:PepSY domain-containing protein [Eubacterium sp.]|uniref:PepSY domain-containing protein n=1 Tax=Eubacterium sp. TaxID=142586 RepID=UPI002FC9EB2A